MKIVLIHGDNIQKSYARYTHILDVAKSRNWEIIHCGEKDKLWDILPSQSLFGGERMIALDSVDKVTKKEWEWLGKNNANLEGNLLLYYPKPAGVTVTKLLPKTTVKEDFPVPKLIWSFLDSFYPGNSKTLLTTFHKITETDAPELVFALICGHLKDIAWAAFGHNGPAYPSWRVSKLKSQAKRWETSSRSKGDFRHPELVSGSPSHYSKLISVIKELSEIDIKVKSSDSNLVDLLDFMIVRQLE